MTIQAIARTTDNRKWKHIGTTAPYLHVYMMMIMMMMISVIIMKKALIPLSTGLCDL